MRNTYHYYDITSYLPAMQILLLFQHKDGNLFKIPIVLHPDKSRCSFWDWCVNNVWQSIGWTSLFLLPHYIGLTLSSIALMSLIIWLLPNTSFVQPTNVGQQTSANRSLPNRQTSANRSLPSKRQPTEITQQTSATKLQATSVISSSDRFRRTSKICTL